MNIDIAHRSQPTDGQAPNLPTLRLESELARLRLQVEVSAAIAPDLNKPLPSPADRQVVVADIVTCWQHLSNEVRHTYDTAEPWQGITGFAKDYFELINEYLEPDADYQPPPLKSWQRDDHIREYLWGQHLTDIRRRAATHQPPPAAWLAHFPIPENQWP